jgi:hypothetical protein
LAVADLDTEYGALSLNQHIQDGQKISWAAFMDAINPWRGDLVLEPTRPNAGVSWRRQLWMLLILDMALYPLSQRELMQEALHTLNQHAIRSVMEGSSYGRY